MPQPISECRRLLPAMSTRGRLQGTHQSSFQPRWPTQCSRHRKAELCSLPRPAGWPPVCLHPCWIWVVARHTGRRLAAGRHLFFFSKYSITVEGHNYTGHNYIGHNCLGRHYCSKYSVTVEECKTECKDNHQPAEEHTKVFFFQRLDSCSLVTSLRLFNNQTTASTMRLLLHLPSAHTHMFKR